MFNEGIESSGWSFSAYGALLLLYAQHRVSLKVLAFDVDFIPLLTVTLPLLLLDLVLRGHIRRRVPLHDFQSEVLVLRLPL